MNELWKLHGRLDFFFYAKAKKPDSKTIYCVVVQPLSPVWLFVTPWTIAHQVPLTSTIYRSLLKFTSTELVILSNSSSSAAPLLLPSIFSSIRVFSNELAFCIRWLKYWSFSISPCREYSGWFALGLTGSISLQSVFSTTTTWKHQFFTDVIDDITWFLNAEPALDFFICIFHMFC